MASGVVSREHLVCNQPEGLSYHLVRYPPNEKLQYRKMRAFHVSHRRDGQVRDVNLRIICGQ